jgi:hypothetical protein
MSVDEPVIDQTLTAGDELACELEAAEVPLTIEGVGEVTLDLAGATTLRVEDNPPDTDGIDVSVPTFKLRTETPELGVVTITMTESDDPPPVSEITEGPSTDTAGVEHAMQLNITVTVANPPEGGEPLVLTSTRTATLLSRSLTTFPPQGAFYELQNPIELVAVGDPNQVVAQIQKFPVSVSHNP